MADNKPYKIVDKRGVPYEPSVAEQVRRIPQGEISIAKKMYDMFSGYINYKQNPSRIIQHGGIYTGSGMQIYKQMKQDGHLRSVLQTRKLAFMGTPWDIRPNKDAEDDKAAEKAADLVRKYMERLLSYKALGELQQAVPIGFKASNLAWWQDGSLWAPYKLQGWKQEWFAFDYDGNLLLITTSDPRGEKLNPYQWVVHQYDAEDDDYYGDGIMNSCFWPWWFKKHGWKFWLILAEVMGIPKVKGTFDPDATTEQQNKLLRVIETLQSETGIIIPSDQTLELLDTTRSIGTGNIYKDLVAACDAEMSKAVLGQTETTQSSEGSGYAQAKVHNEVRHDILEADCRSMKDTIQAQIVERFCALNGIEPVPYIWFDYEESEDLDARSTRRKTYYDMGLKMSKSQIYDEEGIDEPQDEDDVLVKPPDVPAAPAGIVTGGTQPAPPAQQKDKQDPPAADFAEEMSDDDPAGRQVRRKLTVDTSIESCLPKFAERYAETRGMIRAALKGAGSFEAMLKAASKLDLVDEVTDALYGYVLTAKVVGLYSPWHEARIRKPDEFKAERTEFAEYVDYNDFIFYNSLPPKEAMEFLGSRVPMAYDKFQAASEAARAEAFWAARVNNQTIITGLQESIKSAMEFGTTRAEWLANVSNGFRVIGIAPEAPWYLNTVLHNALAYSFEEGQRVAQNDPVIVEAFAWMHRISVADSRRRPEHARVSRIYPRNNAWLLRNDNPMGHQCRCTDVAVDDEYAEAHPELVVSADWDPGWESPFAGSRK